MSQKLLNAIEFLNAAVAKQTDQIAELEHKVQVLEGKVNPIEVKVPKRGRPKKTQ